MLLEAYFDDSSDPRRNRFYACGGFVGARDQWDMFEAYWSHETHSLRQPFRSTDCETGHGQFKSWPKSKRDDLMARLVDVLRKVQLRGFASIVPINEYKEAFPQCGEYDAFLLALRQTIMNMAFIANEIADDVELWFEHGPIDGKIRQVFCSIAGRRQWKPAKRLRGPKFGTKQVRPLQASDLIAREAFKHIDNLGIRPTRAPVARMEGRLYFVCWGIEALAFLASNGGPDNLDILSRWDLPGDAPRLKPTLI